MERLVKLIVNDLEKTVEDVKPETNIRDLAEDSLDLIELVIAIEEEFGIDIADEDINKLITVQDIEDYINNQSGQVGEV